MRGAGEGEHTRGGEVAARVGNGWHGSERSGNAVGEGVVVASRERAGVETDALAVGEERGRGDRAYPVPEGHEVLGGRGDCGAFAFGAYDADDGDRGRCVKGEFARKKFGARARAGVRAVIRLPFAEKRLVPGEVECGHVRFLCRSESQAADPKLVRRARRALKERIITLKIRLSGLTRLSYISVF